MVPIIWTVIISHSGGKKSPPFHAAVNVLRTLDDASCDEHAVAMKKYEHALIEYKQHLTPIMEYVGLLQNLQTTGRQGNFRYNNMDQSVEMGRKVGIELATGEMTDHQAVATAQEYFG